MAAIGIGAMGVGLVTIITCVCCYCFWLMKSVRKCGRGVEVYVKGLYDGLGLLWLRSGKL